MRILQSIKNKKEKIKNFTDKNQRLDDDYRIRKSRIWSTINLICVIPFGLVFYFLVDLVFSELFLGSLIGIIALFAAMVSSATKAIKYTNNIHSLGTIIYSYLIMGIIVLVAAGVIVSRLLLVNVF